MCGRGGVGLMKSENYLNLDSKNSYLEIPWNYSGIKSMGSGPDCLSLQSEFA